MFPDVHKVGVARSPKRRLESLQCASPYKLKLVRVWQHKQPYSVEATAHVAMESHRMIGEWYGVTEEQAILAVNSAIELVAAGKAVPLRRPSTKHRKAALKGGRISADLRMAQAKAKAQTVRPYWGTPTREWTVKMLEHESGLSYHTLQKYLGMRRPAQKQHQTRLKKLAKDRGDE